MAALRRFAAAVAMLLCLPPSAASAQSPADPPIHLGVATCSGGNCHGATGRRPANSRIPGNEYVIWSTRDKHRKSYTVLLEKPALLMARAMGYPDAVHQKQCLDCHADNVPDGQRGPQFHLSDGVGCETCHGGASAWLGLHISGAKHRDNIAAGLVPLERPVVRARTCMGCHVGDATRFVDHRLLGAGHPRLRFELDTFTAIEPAHFVVDRSYIERKGSTAHMQVWAAGQAAAVVKQMDGLLDPKRNHPGVFPEFSIYDCQSCHHSFEPLRGPRPTSTGLGPGTLKLNDANAVMLELIAAQIAPDAKRALGEHMRALIRAAVDEPANMQREAQAVRAVAAGLVDRTATHEFTVGEMRSFADAVVALAGSPDEWRYSHAEQTAMAIEAIVADLKSSGSLTDRQGQTVKKAMDALYASFADETTFRPEAFTAALREIRRAIGK